MWIKSYRFSQSYSNILSQTKLNNYLLLLIVTNTIAVAFVVTCIGLVKWISQCRQWKLDLFCKHIRNLNDRPAASL